MARKSPFGRSHPSSPNGGGNHNTSLDSHYGTTTTSSCGENDADGNDAHDGDGDDDCVPDWDDDMSIGARAALQEHLRQVAKYGVEGTHTNNSDSDQNYHIVDDEQEEQENHDPNHYTLSPQDILWNQLLDDSIPTSSSLSSSQRQPQQPTLPKPKQQQQSQQQQFQISIQHDGTNSNSSIQHHDDDDDYIDEAIEVSLIHTSCCYSDYFNTSKVLLLATPEKNKSQRPPFRITSRNHSTHEDHDDDDDDDDCGDQIDTDPDHDDHDHDDNDEYNYNYNTTHDEFDDAGSFGHAIAADTSQDHHLLSHLVNSLRLHEDVPNDDDVQSLAGVDVSRISAADSEPTTGWRSSPVRYHHHTGGRNGVGGNSSTTADVATAGGGHLLFLPSSSASTTTTPQRKQQQHDTQHQPRFILSTDDSFGSLSSPMPNVPRRYPSSLRQHAHTQTNNNSSSRYSSSSTSRTHPPTMLPFPNDDNEGCASNEFLLSPHGFPHHDNDNDDPHPQRRLRLAPRRLPPQVQPQSSSGGGEGRTMLVTEAMFLQDFHTTTTITETRSRHPQQQQHPQSSNLPTSRKLTPTHQDLSDAMNNCNVSSTQPIMPSSSVWLSPTEVRAAQLADRVGILTSLEPTEPFPFDDNEDLTSSTGANFFWNEPRIQSKHAQATAAASTNEQNQDLVPPVPGQYCNSRGNSSCGSASAASFGAERGSGLLFGETRGDGVATKTTMTNSVTRQHAADINRFLSDSSPSRQSMPTISSSLPIGGGDTSFGSFLVSPTKDGNEDEFNFRHGLFDHRPPSPISHANLSAIEYASMDGNSFLLESTQVNTHNIMSNVKSSPSTMTSSSPDGTNNKRVTTTDQTRSYEDRRRYRTVVPTRVFFDEPEDHRDDSFSIAPSERSFSTRVNESIGSG